MNKARRTVAVSVLALAVFGALLWFGDANRVVALIVRFDLIYLIWFGLVLLAHEFVRGLLWRYLLGSLSIRVPLGTQIFAFAAGEAAKVVPTGAYLQNYVIQRVRGADFGRSSAATTVIIVSEIVVALVGVLILGEGSWSGALRLALLAATVATIAGVWTIARAPRQHVAVRWIPRSRRLRGVIVELARFRIATAELVRPRIVAETLALSAAYVLLAGACLYLVIAAMHIGGVTFWQVIAVNCFGLAFYVVLGSLEAADVAVLVGIGVSKSAAVSAILVNRVLSVGATLIMAAIVMYVLRDTWRAMFSPSGRRS